MNFFQSIFFLFFKTSFKKQQGFSLIELMLSIGISSFIFLSVVQYNLKQAEINKAEISGQQLQEVGQALSLYIARENVNIGNNLATGNTIVMPFNTLTGTTNGFFTGATLLPTTYQDRNIYGFTYNIIIRNDGGVIRGLVTSSLPIIDSGGVVRYDWIGSLMQKIGPSAGVVFMAAGTLTGLDASWTLVVADYPNIGVAGIVGYRTGFNASYDDIYLRLDGTYPMNGSLNMGNYNIDNVTDLNSTGWINANNILANNLVSGNIFNNGSIQTASITGTVANNFAQFERLIATRTVETTAINQDSGSDLTLGTGSNGRLYVRDIYLNTNANPGSGGRTIAGWLSDLLPRYSSRGIYAVQHGTNLTKPTCNGGTPKIELISQVQFAQGRVLGNLEIETVADPVNVGFEILVLRQDQYTVSVISVYAVDNGADWTVNFGTIDYGAINPVPTVANQYVDGVGLAHIYCDYNF